MKRVIVSFIFICVTLLTSSGQNKKAEKEAAAQAKYQKAVAAIEAKDFVIIVDSYDSGDGNFETNTDRANFLSYEKDFAFLQGEIISGNTNTNKLTVSDYSQNTDKKGNIRISLHVRNNFINSKVEISMKKGGSYADVIITPSQGKFQRFSGDVTPRSESKYFKRSGEI